MDWKTLQDSRQINTFEMDCPIPSVPYGKFWKYCKIASQMDLLNITNRNVLIAFMQLFRP